MFKLRSLTGAGWVLIFRSDNFYSMFVPSLPSSNQSPLTRPTCGVRHTTNMPGAHCEGIFRTIPGADALLMLRR